MYIHIYVYRAIVFTYLYTDYVMQIKTFTLQLSYKKCNKDWKVVFAQANCVAVKPSQLHICGKKSRLPNTPGLHGTEKKRDLGQMDSGKRLNYYAMDDVVQCPEYSRECPHKNAQRNCVLLLLNIVQQ